MNELVEINLFGELGKYVGYKTWKLNIKSVREAIHAINSLTKGKFNDYFIKNNKLQAKYRVLINGEDFICSEKELNETNWQKVNQSELVMNKKDLKTIDIVPLIESSGRAGGIVSAILGILLIIVGIIVIVGSYATGTGLGAALIVAGLSLLGSGVVALLSRPPTFNYNQGLDNAISQSYLFNGPTNTVGEGGPVPVGYGTMLIGSNVISSAYQISEFQTTNIDEQ